jgi:hypothetical protein
VDGERYSASRFQDQVLGPPSIDKFVFLWPLQVFISSSYVTCPWDPGLITGESRALIFSRYRQFGLEEVTAVMVGDALLALMAKSGRVLPIMARRALDFEQPFLRVSAVVRSAFALSFLQRQHS